MENFILNKQKSHCKLRLLFINFLFAYTTLFLLNYIFITSVFISKETDDKFIFYTFTY